MWTKTKNGMQRSSQILCVRGNIQKQQHFRKRTASNLARQRDNTSSGTLELHIHRGRLVSFRVPKVLLSLMQVALALCLLTQWMR